MLLPPARIKHKSDIILTQVHRVLSWLVPTRQVNLVLDRVGLGVLDSNELVVTIREDVVRHERRVQPSMRVPVRERGLRLEESVLP